MGRPRGRPREFDSDQALDRILNAFWETGYSGTSLDRLSEVTGIARPSLYAAFGDKKAQYLAALSAFTARLNAIARATLTGKHPARNELRTFFDACLSVYASGAHRARGCFVMCTASAESVTEAEIRRALADTIHAMDDALGRFFQAAQERGELRPDQDPAHLAKFSSAVLQSAAIRARAGFAPEEIRSLAEEAVVVLFGRPGHSPRRPPRSAPPRQRGHRTPEH